jgi:hypothetical protein
MRPKRRPLVTVTVTLTPTSGSSRGARNPSRISRSSTPQDAILCSPLMASRKSFLSSSECPLGYFRTDCRDHYRDRSQRRRINSLEYCGRDDPEPEHSVAIDRSYYDRLGVAGVGATAEIHGEPVPVGAVSDVSKVKEVLASVGLSAKMASFPGQLTAASNSGSPSRAPSWRKLQLFLPMSPRRHSMAPMGTQS